MCCHRRWRPGWRSPGQWADEPAYLVGNALQRASGTIDLALGAAAVVALAVVLLAVRRQSGRLAVRAEAAYPGPLERAGRGGPDPAPAQSMTAGGDAGTSPAASAVESTPGSDKRCCHALDTQAVLARRGPAGLAEAERARRLRPW